MRSWKKLVRTVSGFSCFAIELQLKCLLCVALRFLQIARKVLSSARPKCCPSLFFCNRRVLSSSSVPIISLVSINVCAFAVSKSKGLCHAGFAECLSLDFNERTASTALRSVVNQSKSSTCTRLASSLFDTMMRSICVWASPGSVQLHRVYSSCSEPASIQVFVTVRSSSATTACNARARKVSFVSVSVLGLGIDSPTL